MVVSTQYKFSGEYDDLRAISSVRPTGPSAPSVTAFIGAYYTYEFIAGANKELHTSVQFSHGMRTGSSVIPHVHFSTNTTTATGVVKWVLEYTVGDNIDAFSGSLTGIDNSYTFTTNKQYSSIYLALPTIDLSAHIGNNELSIIILGRLYRDTTVGSNFADSVWLNEFDYHYQLDTIGSVQELSKT